jgi:hypothetical protein
MPKAKGTSHTVKPNVDMRGVKPPGKLSRKARSR